MKIMLIHPPLDDPTIPYHSTAYLAGHLRHNGFSDVTTRDINIEFVNYCLDAERVTVFNSEIERKLHQFEAKPLLDLLEQEEFLGLWKTIKGDVDAPRKAAMQMRRMDTFLDYNIYIESVRTLERYFRLLGALSYPSEIRRFRQYSMGNYSIYNFNDLFNAELADRTCHPMVQYFQDRLLVDPDFLESNCIGISIVYDHQLMYALWLARTLKRRWPDKLIVLGGTAVSGIYKHAKSKSEMKRFFDVCDAIVVGEGETAMCEIANSDGDLTKAGDIPNTITYDRVRDQVVLPARIHYENVPNLGTPVYDFPWDLYLSPTRGINYAPTRGCYWNRCTFCDYGLNTDKPTSPWRERKIEQVLADLAIVTKEQSVRYVYFAVDVMAPGYLERLSDGIVAAGLDIRWAAELRMEKIFSLERCSSMAAAGCVCVSFGMESGNQRVLDLIDKGTRVSCMADTMKNFGQTRVAVQLMAFKGFPSETLDEANETRNFIRTNKDLWSNGGLGDFVLTGAAIIAQKPRQFGLTLLETKNVDIERMVNYREESGANSKPVLLEESGESFEASDEVFPATVGRPWAGGIDTLHSMIYYDNCGKEFFKNNRLPEPTPGSTTLPSEFPNCILRLNGILSGSCFDIDQIHNNVKHHKEHAKKLRHDLFEPTFDELSRWQTNVSPLIRTMGDKGGYIISQEKGKKIPPLLYALISVAISGEMTLEQILPQLEPAVRSKVLKSLENLHGYGLLEFMPLTSIRNGTQNLRRS
jgi:anaerobic magnesium-protoporphyrin IX monomethyl ester cyclase